MTYFVVEGFGGINRKMDPKRVPDTVAQKAINCTLDRGAVLPLNAEANKGHGTIPASSVSMFWYKRSQWLTAPYDADLAEIPVERDKYDRVIITTDSGPTPYPRVYSNGAYYRAGLPIPGQILTSASQPPEDPDDITAETVSYVCTFVDSFGVEGPPSTPSRLTDRVVDTEVTLTLPGVPLGDWNFGTDAKKRIYRSSSGMGQNLFLYAGEVPITDLVAVDTIPADELQEPLPSATWVGPPDDDDALYPQGPMIGVCAFANGILAGFAGKTLCFSEPFLYHAWPVEYRITLEDDVIAIAPISGGLLAVTHKRPYLVAGAHPAAMALVQLDEQTSNEGLHTSASRGCINKRGMVDMGGFALYPSADGLVMVEGNNALVVTEGLLTREQWQEYNPGSYSAYAFEGTYIAFCGGGRGFIFDPKKPDKAFVETTRSYNSGAYDPLTGDLLVNDNGTVKVWGGDTSLTAASPYQWKSRKFIAPKQVSLSTARVECWYDLATYPITMKVWADGVELPTITLNDPVWKYHRLPAGFRAKVWEFEVSGKNPISYAGIFESMDEVI